MDLEDSDLRRCWRPQSIKCSFSQSTFHAQVVCREDLAFATTCRVALDNDGEVELCILQGLARETVGVVAERLKHSFPSVSRCTDSYRASEIRRCDTGVGTGQVGGNFHRGFGQHRLARCDGPRRCCYDIRHARQSNVPCLTRAVDGATPDLSFESSMIRLTPKR
jgi:hypothetical protein